MNSAGSRCLLNQSERVKSAIHLLFILINNISEIYGLSQLIKEGTLITIKKHLRLFIQIVSIVVCSGVSHIGISYHSLVYTYRKLSIDPQNRAHSTNTYTKI